MDISQSETSQFVTLKLSNFQLIWDAFIKVKSKQKAEKLLRQVKNKLGLPITITTNTPYWKDKTLYHVIFSCSINTNQINEAVFQTLQLNSKMASKWIVSSPCHQKDDKWHFAGTAQNILIPGIELLSFHLQNYEHTYQKEI